MNWLADHGVQTRPYFTPIHLQPFYVSDFGYRTGDFPVTERVAERTISLPFFTMITPEQQEEVVSMLKEGLLTCRKERRA
jgi:perosamine synthetase